MILFLIVFPMILQFDTVSTIEGNTSIMHDKK